jgi:hypothetical protein
MTPPQAMTPRARESAPKADEVPSIGVFPLLRLGLLGQGAEGFAPWVSRTGIGSARIHIASRSSWLLVEGHPVVLTLLPAFGRSQPCRPQFQCPSCDRRCGRLYKVAEAIHPWRCVRCAGLEYRVRHLKPIERAERAVARLSLDGRERRPREKRRHYYRRLARLLAAEQRLSEIIARYLQSERKPPSLR